jgi:hypothetical protein
MHDRNTLILGRRGCLRVLCGGAALAACSSGGMPSEEYEGMMPDGMVEMEQYQAAYIGSGSAGHGTLTFKGKTYPFDVGGLGIGGIGISKIEAAGYVYKLRDVSQFAGAYGQVRYGYAAGDKSGGDLLLQNPAGVILRVRAKRQGLMLSLGADAMVITMS